MPAESADELIQHGYPNIELVRDSICMLYRGLSRNVLSEYAKSISLPDTLRSGARNSVVTAEAIAELLIKHLCLPEAEIAVRFSDVGDHHAARVRLTPSRLYTVEISPRVEARDFGAVLSHEVMHVFLHQKKLALNDVARNEILTDVAAAYLGVGWLEFDAYRVTEFQDGPGRTVTRSERKGYLTPEEFGYVLAKRAAVLGEDPMTMLNSPAARSATTVGAGLARLDHRRPPLRGGSIVSKLRYIWARDRIARSAKGTGLSGRSRVFRDGYRFDIGDQPRVVFRCPTCCQKLRAPIKRSLVVSCQVCGSRIACDT